MVVAYLKIENVISDGIAVMVPMKVTVSRNQDVHRHIGNVKAVIVFQRRLCAMVDRIVGIDQMNKTAVSIFFYFVFTHYYRRFIDVQILF